MKSTPILLSLHCDCWQVFVNNSGTDRQNVTCRIPFDASGGPLSVTQELAKKMDAFGYGGQEVCLGLDGSFVYGVTIECDDLPRRGRQQMLLYRLEEQIPLAAEELSAVFLPSVAGRCLALAVQSEFFMKTICGLAAAGIEVGPICPTALLSLWACMQQCGMKPNYIILCHGGEMELFRIIDGVPHDWYSANDGSHLLNSLRISLLNCPIEHDNNALALIAGPLDKDTLAAIEKEIPIKKIGENDEDFFERTASEGAEFMLIGKPAGWVDFRTGRLARKKVWGRSGGLMRTAAVLSLLLVIAMMAAFITRGVRYNAVASDYQRQQNEAYGKFYPGQKVPKDVPSRLDSELRKLSGVLGHGQDVPETSKTLDNLCTVIEKLPNKIRLRILKIQIEPETINIEGQVKTHTDAEAIVQTLTAGGLDALAPRTERLASGDVSFVITAKSAPEKSAATGRGAKR